MSFSDPRVISTLNRYFVPVYISNEEYRRGGSAPPEEQKELQRIFQEGYAKKLSVGTVHAYVLGPDGHLLDSRHVAQAYKAGEMLALLEGAVQKLGTQAGEPLVKPVPQSAAQAKPGELLLHLTARYLEKKGDGYVLTEDRGGGWSAIPGEDWIGLDTTQWRRLLPAEKPKAGGVWNVDGAVAASLLRYFYPPTENNDVNKDQLNDATLKAVVESVGQGTARARITGTFKLRHSFYHKEDGKVARGSVVGFLEWETAGAGRVRSLELVTDTAAYGAEGAPAQPFGVAVQTAHAP